MAETVHALYLTAGPRPRHVGSRIWKPNQGFRITQPRSIGLNQALEDDFSPSAQTCQSHSSLTRCTTAALVHRSSMYGRMLRLSWNSRLLAFSGCSQLGLACLLIFRHLSHITRGRARDFLIRKVGLPSKSSGEDWQLITVEGQGDGRGDSGLLFDLEKKRENHVNFGCAVRVL